MLLEATVQEEVNEVSSWIDLAKDNGLSISLFLVLAIIGMVKFKTQIGSGISSLSTLITSLFKKKSD